MNSDRKRMIVVGTTQIGHITHLADAEAPLAKTPEVFTISRLHDGPWERYAPEKRQPDWKAKKYFGGRNR